VESTSLLLAERFGQNPDYCSLAGLSHDICREMNRFELENLTGRTAEHYVLLHGHAGAEFLKKEFHMENQSILDAVRYHTSGNRGLDDIAKIVFLSDYLEPGRTHVSDRERNRLSLLTLDDMVLAVAHNIKTYLLGKKYLIEPELNEMILDLSKEK
jgi:predicted HD superfamily hydrolase involved in NAD metabolism